MSITLVLGGTRSGKSAIAEQMATAAARRDPVTYVVAGAAGDASVAARIDRHRQRRPEGWRTVEATGDPAHLPALLTSTAGVVVVDSLGSWLACHEGFSADVAALVNAMLERAGDSVVVSEEVGLAAEPATPAGRTFADALGEANQEVAAVAEQVVLAIAGRALELPDPGLP